jgi:L-alanine-DL-glutamate epimerase-like enolase superfamily enzyme
MKIVKVEDLHCDAGWRVNSFLKITTDEGIVGWSEYMEGYGAQGLTAVIQKLAARLIGQDPRPVERHSAYLYAAARQAAGGVNQMAIAAIENALVDIKAKGLGCRSTRRSADRCATASLASRSTPMTQQRSL